MKFRSTMELYGRKQVQPRVSGYLYCPYPYLHSYLYLRLYCDKYIRVESTKSSAVVIKAEPAHRSKTSKLRISQVLKQHCMCMWHVCCGQIKHYTCRNDLIWTAVFVFAVITSSFVPLGLTLFLDPIRSICLSVTGPSCWKHYQIKTS